MLVSDHMDTARMSDEDSWFINYVDYIGLNNLPGYQVRRVRLPTGAHPLIACLSYGSLEVPRRCNMSLVKTVPYNGGLKGFGGLPAVMGAANGDQNYTVWASSEISIGRSFPPEAS